MTLTVVILTFSKERHLARCLTSLQHVFLRIHVGAGYRVYYGQHGKAVVILLCGGDKSSQTADINRAKAFWLEWKRRQP